MPRTKRPRDRQSQAEIESMRDLDSHLISSARVFFDGSALYQNNNKGLVFIVDPPKPGRFEIVSDEYPQFPTASTLNAAKRYIDSLVHDILGPGEYEILVMEKQRRVFQYTSSSEYNEEQHADHFCDKHKVEDDEDDEDEPYPYGHPKCERDIFCFRSDSSDDSD